jgi:hypothetical protein
MRTPFLSVNFPGTPRFEVAAQPGSHGYAKKSRAACEAMKAQILRHYPVPNGVDAGIQTLVLPHENGSQRTLALAYCESAGGQWVELVLADPKMVLSTWDAESIKALGLTETA